MLPNVDVILPCYRPHERWHHELQQFYNVAKTKYQLQFIIVDDGSQSTSLQSQIRELEALQIPLKFISYPHNKGKGYALRTGVKAAESEFIIYTDIDFPFRDDSTLALLNELCSKKSNVVAGYRDQAYYLNKMSLFRKLLSRSFRFFIQRVLQMPVSDTQCGLKGFDQKGKLLFLNTGINRYLFDFEFIFVSARNKQVVIHTVPVQLKDNIVFSKMKLKILLQESFNLVRVLLFRKS
jgi:glycosyltransferase involved in cell wall biosynthesis